jgi:Flp pilus assembly protein TadD
MRENQISDRRIGIGYVLLLFLIFLAYSNTFDASWHLDDLPHITQNPVIHIKDISPGSIAQTFFAHPNSAERLYRPVACLTFALNWYMGKDNVVGYHFVNMVVHVLTAWALLITILNLFKTPNLKGRYQGNAYCIALLAASLWAINPVQTQAVTYIVQRMASMAALFYILGIYFYIKVRLNVLSFKRILFSLGCVFSFLLAVGSKENAIILPFALILVELLFFTDLSRPQAKRIISWFAAISAILVVVVGTFILLKADYFSILKSYESRSFTLAERLLTEPRILIIYLSQIFFPLPQRLSFQQDIQVSTSLLDPWTTLPAMVLILFLVVFGIFQIKRRPILAFGILFFFLNHTIESTILPLELYYEHRNYLPTLFIFWPVAEWLKRLLTYFRLKGSIAYRGFIVLLTVILFGLSFGTYVRNSVWATEKSLWEDVRMKAPGIARPYQGLAAQHARAGQYDIAFNLYERALALKHPTPKVSQAHSFNNMGNIQMYRRNYAEAIKLYQAALKIYPGHEKSLYNMTLALINCGRWQEAYKHADMLIAKFAVNASYFNLKGLILMKQGRYQEARSVLLEALKIAPFNRNAAVNMGIVLSLTGKHEQAANLFKRVQRHYPRDIAIQFAQIENHSRAGDESAVDIELEKLLAQFSTNDIISYLNEMIDNKMPTPLSPETIVPLVASRLKKKSEEIKAFYGPEK